MDAGGLAQMTYQSNFHNSIGVSGPGYASRGKATNLKRLSVALPPKISTIDETQQTNAVSTPRASRGHLLAGLRTAPKSATIAPTNVGLGLDSSRFASAQPGYQVPQTATGAFFPNKRASIHSYLPYSVPEQVLSPPALDFHHGTEAVDQSFYNELVATNNYLAQQQRALQQQLANVTAAAQQLGALNLNAGLVQSPQMYQAMSPPMNLYSQQLPQGLQPVVQVVPGNPGLYSVYNPMTGQSSFVVDQAPAQTDIASHRLSMSASPPTAGHLLHRQNSDPSTKTMETRSITPPKSVTSPSQDVEPLPPPSANAFRRTHRKNVSSANVKTTGEWTRVGGLKSAGIPATPMTGTFGPGQGRAGEHPVRQPRGPPLLQELEEKPTSKHEGSKNFATRQRRRAVHDLVRAGRERRSDGKQAGSATGSPGSEKEFNFSGSDNDSVLAGSTELSSISSLNSFRAAVSGAIGSERKEASRERSSVDSTASMSTRSSTGDENTAVPVQTIPAELSRRAAPRFLLNSAEKRKSMIV